MFHLARVIVNLYPCMNIDKIHKIKDIWPLIMAAGRNIYSLWIKSKSPSCGVFLWYFYVTHVYSNNML
jgi:hypothetical protein